MALVTTERVDPDVILRTILFAPAEVRDQNSVNALIEYYHVSAKGEKSGVLVEWTDDEDVVCDDGSLSITTFSRDVVCLASHDHTVIHVQGGDVYALFKGLASLKNGKTALSERVQRIVNALEFVYDSCLIFSRNTSFEEVVQLVEELYTSYSLASTSFEKPEWYDGCWVPLWYERQERFDSTDFFRKILVWRDATTRADLSLIRDKAIQRIASELHPPTFRDEEEPDEIAALPHNIINLIQITWLNRFFAFNDNSDGKVMKLSYTKDGRVKDVLENDISCVANSHPRLGFDHNGVWRTSPYTRRIRGFDFGPNVPVDDGHVNTFSGYNSVPCNIDDIAQEDRGKVREGVDFIMRHMREIICNSNPEVFDFLMNWFANTCLGVRKLRVFVVLYSKGNQVGKGAMIDFFTFILGKYAAKESSNQSSTESLLSGFNGIYKNLLLTWMDEAMWAAEKSKKMENAIKEWTSAPRVEYRTKHKKAEWCNDYSSLIVCTNELAGFSVSEEDRRTAIFHVAETFSESSISEGATFEGQPVTKELVQTYFTTFYEHAHNPNVQAVFMYELLQKYKDCLTFDFQGRIPRTAIRDATQEGGNLLAAFMSEVKSGGVLIEDEADGSPYSFFGNKAPEPLSRWTVDKPIEYTIDCIWSEAHAYVRKCGLDEHEANKIVGNSTHRFRQFFFSYFQRDMLKMRKSHGTKKIAFFWKQDGDAVDFLAEYKSKFNPIV